MEDVILTVGGAQLSGWTEVRVTRRIEACPNDFEIAFTDRFPGEPNAFVVQAGNPCVLAIGDDTVVTGYVDRFTRTYDARSRRFAISGRGKTQDLVDCSAEWQGGQISGANVLQIAQKLAAPYGITVTCLSDPGPQIPRFNLTLGETAFDIIERICRYAGLLAYEGTDGNLILANTQTTQAASGFVEGENVLSAHVFSSMDQRFSEYDALRLAMDVLDDVGSGGNMIASVTDPNVPRHRKTFIIAEVGDGAAYDVTRKRALWEAARRIGRSSQATLVTTGWRDSAGTLWTPNTQAPVSLPGLDLDPVTWTIGEVTYRLAADGEICELVQMDPRAFTPEPVILVPIYRDVNPGTPGA